MAQLTVPAILAWDSDAIYDAFRIAKDREGTFNDFGENLKRVHNTVGEWGGAAGDAFHQSMGKRRADIEADGRESARVAKAIARAEHDVESVQIRMRAAVNFLNKNHIDVADDGTLTAQSGYESDPNTRKVLAAQAKTGNGLTVNEIMADANRVDEELASSIRAAVGDEQLDDDGRPAPHTKQPPQPPQPSLVTPEQLTQIFPSLADDPAKAKVYQQNLNEAMREYGIDTPKRAAAFLAQLSVETDGFNTLTEYADGSEYEGRTDMGNVNPGDGPKYKGRGAIQLTGHNHYRDASRDPRLNMPFLEDHPERAADPENAFRIAAWYWTNPSVTANGQDLNILADGAGPSDSGMAQFRAITEGVRGGSYTEPNAHEDRREAAYLRALEVLHAS